MAQVISDSLKGYLVCCASGLPTEVSSTPLYFFMAWSLQTTRADIKTYYNTFLPTTLDPLTTRTFIDSVLVNYSYPIYAGHFGYSTPNKTLNYSPINYDVSTFDAFWNDINGYVYANNLPDLIYEPLTDRYKIDSFSNNVYMYTFFND